MSPTIPAERSSVIPSSHRPSPVRKTSSPSIITIAGPIDPHLHAVECIDPIGVFYLQQDVNDLPAGTVLVPNRDLSRRTKTTHMAYTAGLYSAFRAGRHIVHGSGLTPMPRRGETHELREDVETARAYVHVLLSLGIAEGETREQLRRVLGRLSHARSIHKVIAHDHLLRGSRVLDVRGRRNPVAAAMVTGAGIQHLLHRQKDVGAINIRVSRRTVAIWNALEHHLAPFERLRVALSGKQPMDFPSLLARARSGDVGEEQLVRRAIDFVNVFSAASHWPLPFRKNGMHVHQDCIALASYRSEGLSAAEAMLAKLKRGITWVFAQRFLEMEILSPLSYAMEEMAYIRRVRVRNQLKDPDLFADIWGEPRLVRVHRALESFITRLGQCSDEGLDRPVKKQLELLATAASQDLRGGKWLHAKRHLKQASALL